jgi:hypothetical protein
MNALREKFREKSLNPRIKMAAKLGNLRAFYAKKTRDYSIVNSGTDGYLFSGIEQDQAFRPNQLST